MSHNNPPVRNAVLECLREHGPMTMVEIAEMLSWSLVRVHGAIMGARSRHPGKLVRVVAYVRHAERGKDIQVYAAGAGKDKPRPVLTEEDRKARRKVVQNRYNHKNRQVIDAKARIKRAKSQGFEPVAHPWFQLIPPSVRGLATQMARSSQ
jgi:hypothetical protein